MAPRAAKRRRLSPEPASSGNSTETAVPQLNGKEVQLGQNGRHVSGEAFNGSSSSSDTNDDDDDNEVMHDLNGTESYQIGEDSDDDGDTEDEDEQEGDDEEDGESAGDEEEEEAGADEDKDKADTAGHGKASHMAKSSKSPSMTPNGFVKPSQTFKGRAEQLLEQLSPEYGSRNLSGAEGLLRGLKALIEQIREREPESVDTAERYLLKSRKTVTPFPQPRPARDAQYKLGFKKPAAINVVGSYALKTATSSTDNLIIDMVVTMPSNLFTEKDYLNHRYFHKRAYYLACIAAELRDAQKDLRAEVKYTNLHGNSLLPVLLVEPSPADLESEFSKSACSIRIIPAISDSLFPAQKTLPDRNAVRSVGEEVPTPFYNATVRTDASVTAYLKFLHGTAAKIPAYRHACMLGRVWLRQRGLTSSINGGGFGNFEWLALTAILLQTGGQDGRPVLSSAYDSTQLFRATLQFLARRDLCKYPLYGFTAERYTLPDLPMVFDGNRGLNILYKMTPASYRILLHEAQTSLKLLTNNTQEQFDSTFVLRVDEPLERFDVIARLPLLSLGLATYADNIEDAIQQKASKLNSILKHGLGNRITALSIVSPELPAWVTSSGKPRLSQDDAFTLRMSLDINQAARVVDRGPAAEDSTEGARFREFWGDKAELRRFKDGSIIHSVVWSPKEPSALLEDICAYLIKQHFGQQAAKASMFHSLLTAGLIKADDATYRTSFDQLQAAYKELENTLRTTKGLPLDIRSIQPSSPLLSSTSVSLPFHSSISSPADVAVQFEGNSRWPDDLRGIQMTKVAFLLKLSDLLSVSNRGGISARIGLENNDSDILNRSFLEVSYSSGASFRVRIHHEREQVLLEKRVANKSSTPAAREAAAAALAVYKRTFIKRPLHTQALAKATTRFPALAGTARLLKKWFAAHLLAPHVPEEVIELIAARVFAHPQPWTVPATSAAGFLRALRFLSRWDWGQIPLIVDFSAAGGAGMKAADYAAIRTRFAAWRAVDPALHRVVLVTATDFDTDGATWTDGARPSRVIAARMVALARSACDVVQRKGQALELKSLFKSSLKEYDFVLHLAPRFKVGGADARSSASGKTRYKNLELARADAGEDAAPAAVVRAFVAEMEALYGETAVLFWDGEDGGDKGAVAGLWSPGAARRRWKVNLGYASVPVEDGDTDAGEVQLDRMAVLGEIARIGGDMIERVEVR